KVKVKDLENTNRLLFPSGDIRIFNRVDFSSDPTRETSFFACFTLGRLLRWLTALDQAFGKSPGFSIVRLNERDFGLSILHPIHHASRGNLPRSEDHTSELQ